MCVCVCARAGAQANMYLFVCRYVFTCACVCAAVFILICTPYNIVVNCYHLRYVSEDVPVSYKPTVVGFSLCLLLSLVVCGTTCEVRMSSGDNVSYLND